jgi:hypothetical protein
MSTFQRVWQELKAPKMVRTYERNFATGSLFHRRSTSGLAVAQTEYLFVIPALNKQFCYLIRRFVHNRSVTVLKGANHARAAFCANREPH